MKKIIKKIFNDFGLEITRYLPGQSSSGYLVKSFISNDIDLVLDVGANSGQFSCSIIKAGYSGRVISFEPLEEAFKMLLQNSSPYKNWGIYPRCAIGEKNKIIEINISHNSVSSSVLDILESHVAAAPNSKYVGTQLVEMHALDDIFPEICGEAKSCFIKIDTQGYEWEVLDGAMKILPSINGLLIELSLLPLYKGQKLLEDYLARLNEMGFSCWGYQPAFIDPNTGRMMQVDALFYKK